MQSWPMAVAVTNRDIYVFAREIDVMQRARYAEVDLAAQLSASTSSTNSLPQTDRELSAFIMLRVSRRAATNRRY